MGQKSVDNALLLPTMYLRQAGLTRNPTFSYLYCVRCRGQNAASKAPLERKYSRWRSFAMKDWRTYFNERLTHSGQFIVENESRHGQTDFLIFKNTTDHQTLIKVGILDNGDLITFEIYNPRTPGFNEQQRREYFYKFSFHPTESYSGPGLGYIQLNIDHFDKFLKEGLKGKEIQYFKNGELKRSEVFQFYAENGDNDFGTTIEFEKKGFWNRLKDLFKSKADLYDKIEEIELKKIFNGVN
jgi:hypothetical protein